MEFRIHDYDELTSTNDELKRFASQNAPEGTVIYTRVQTAGRGRLGRSWAGEPGACLMFSLLLRPVFPGSLTQNNVDIAPYKPMPLAEAAAWSLAAGLGVCRAIRRVADVDAMVKWPNDVVADGRKLCGILTEHVAGDCLITGIGVNVNQIAFPEEISGKATSLRMLAGREIDSDILFRAILKELDDLYAAFAQSGFAPLAPTYNALCVNTNAPVLIHKPNGSISGTARGADAAGHLMVNTDDGLIRLPAGEVSVRLADGRYA